MITLRFLKGGQGSRRLGVILLVSERAKAVDSGVVASADPPAVEGRNRFLPSSSVAREAATARAGFRVQCHRRGGCFAEGGVSGID